MPGPEIFAEFSAPQWHTHGLASARARAFALGIRRQRFTYVRAQRESFLVGFALLIAIATI